MNQVKTTGNSPNRILLASLVGTTIEFFDFYIYATAAVLVFPKLFFPSSDPTSATLQSLATFALAFFARPLGAAKPLRVSTGPETVFEIGSRVWLEIDPAAMVRVE